MLVRRMVPVMVACLGCMAMATAWSSAQEPARPEAKGRAKDEVKGRLPVYFGQIGLSKKQEEEVRRVAKPFDEKLIQAKKQIADLEKLIDELEGEKLVACERTLSDGQRAALKERRDTAEAEKVAKRKAPRKGDPPAPPAGNDPK